MGKVINIISLNVKLAAHKSFYNLATMAVKGNTDNKFNFLSRTIVHHDIKVQLFAEHLAQEDKTQILVTWR